MRLLIISAVLYLLRPTEGKNRILERSGPLSEWYLRYQIRKLQQEVRRLERVISKRSKL